jgi:hypothetical protein
MLPLPRCLSIRKKRGASREQVEASWTCWGVKRECVVHPKLTLGRGRRRHTDGCGPLQPRPWPASLHAAPTPPPHLAPCNPFACDILHQSHHDSDIQTLGSHCASSAVLLASAHSTIFCPQSSTRSQSFLRNANCSSYTWLDAEPNAGSAAEKHHVDGRYRASQVVRSVTWRKGRANDTAELQPGGGGGWHTSYCKSPIELLYLYGF